MQLVAIDVEGFRSIASARIACGRLTVLVGEGDFVTDAVAAIGLLRDAAEGVICAALGDGAVAIGRSARDRLVLGARFSRLFYRIALRLPGHMERQLGIGPMVLSEHVTIADTCELLLERRGGGVWLRDSDGQPRSACRRIGHDETALSVVGASGRPPALAELRETMRGWCFVAQTEPTPPLRRAKLEPVDERASLPTGWRMESPTRRLPRNGSGAAEEAVSSLVAFRAHGERPVPGRLKRLAGAIWRASQTSQVLVAGASTPLVEQLDSRRFPDAVIHHDRAVGSTGRRLDRTAAG